MFCRNCGHEINPNDKFCRNCGSSIDEIVTVSQEAQSAFSLVSNGISETSNLVNEIANSMQVATPPACSF